MNRFVKRSLQLSGIAATLLVLAGCDIRTDEMWSSDGFDTYSTHTVVERYDTRPYHRHHWHHHWRRGWEPAPSNQGHYGPPPAPPANQGHYGPPPAQPTNQGHYGPARQPANQGHYGPARNSNSGHYGPASSGSNDGGHYGPSKVKKPHHDGAFDSIVHTLKH